MLRRHVDTPPTPTPSAVMAEYVLDLGDTYNIPATSPQMSEALVVGMKAYRDGFTLNEALMLAKGAMLHPSRGVRRSLA